MGFTLKRVFSPHRRWALHIIDPQGTRATANMHHFGNSMCHLSKYVKLSLRERERNTQKRRRALGEATKQSGKMQAIHQSSTKEQQNSLKRTAKRVRGLQLLLEIPSSPTSPILKLCLAGVSKAHEVEGDASLLPLPQWQETPQAEQICRTVFLLQKEVNLKPNGTLRCVKWFKTESFIDGHGCRWTNQFKTSVFHRPPEVNSAEGSPWRQEIEKKKNPQSPCFLG